ncbi:hypothetical protein HNQ07_002855 [Deinococcus metalli]|uniref:Uncharacterized protein n=1 Tax=Deinococcus metalli TaxID=1141878 RepID=A0A7W8KHM8_9DEIO|nr:hypothetical protein [Deinococcus metalli]MBB5377363.1 hypothetical protein [Deinococcus metalli]GHF49884.1 hypothetical protein GCM10017781_27890 [Deinococcus metalli]
MRIPILPALTALLASCAPLMQQSLPGVATSRTFGTSCTIAFDSVVLLAPQQKPSSTAVSWGRWSVQGRTATTVTLQAQSGTSVATSVFTCTQAGNRATLTMRSSGPNMNPTATNEGFLANLDLPR